MNPRDLDMSHRMQLKHLMIAHEDYGRYDTSPGIMDIAYTAFMAAKAPNKEDGGPSDWFNDVRPLIQKEVDRLKGRYAAREEGMPNVDEIAEAAKILARAGSDRLKGMSGSELDMDALQKIANLRKWSY
jgi:hypothetical protein